MGLIRYAFSGDEIVPQGAPTVALDDGDFWGGVARCGVAVAIAAAAVPARPAFAADDDFPVAAAPAAIVDEDYQPVAVSPPTPWPRLYLPDPEEIPAGSLFGLPDEDAWTPPRPCVQAMAGRAFTDDSDVVSTVAAVLGPDEDFWAPPPQPWPAFARLYLPDADELVVTAAAPVTIVDEDAWTPPPPRAAPWTARILADDSDVVAPVATLAAEEDAWQPRTAMPAPWPRLYLPDAEDVAFVPAAPLGIDEEVWFPGPMRATAYAALYLPDADDVPAGSLVPPPPPPGPTDADRFLAWLQLRQGFPGRRGCC